MRKYDHKKIESKWQKEWDKSGIYEASNFSKKEKYYPLTEFPYPSGDGLHVGHLRPYVGIDIIARKKRQEGFNVLYPMGWDAFGLPTENHAIKTGIHPKIITQKNTDNFRRQFKSTGFSFDWSREINTTDPEYYKWTQWIFLQWYKNGLAYKKNMPINWCLSCKTGLADEEVADNKCERCGGEIEKRNKNQWMIAITKYADRLDKDLDAVDFLEKIKTQQRNWIGKSEGVLIKFQIIKSKLQIKVFTTRPDTIFGATYLVLSPEHEFVKNLESQITNWGEVQKYIKQAIAKSDIDRITEGKEKTGVELRGIKAINLANNKEIPIYVADYVLPHYGTGAIMAVPAYDERDFEFAKKYNLSIKKVVTNEGILINSGEFDGMKSEEAREKIIKKINGVKKTTYKLRDWVFSRQRYWGEPIPIIHCNKCGIVPVPEKDLPIKLPDIEKYQPTNDGESPLAEILDWVNVKCPKCREDAKRETDTMPNWAGSNWYFLRYLDHKNNKALADKKKISQWMPVDWYNGGMEHTTLHLLYSRFCYKFLYDIKIVPNIEPYKKRTSHGMILAKDGKKMSKSLGNVINPDEIIKTFGADTLRVFEMFIGPFDQTVNWNTDNIMGSRRFIEKVWRLHDKLQLESSKSNNHNLEKLLHKTIKKVGENIENMSFNTAISTLMILFNEFEKQSSLEIKNYELGIKLLAPFAPHVTEEIWQELGNKKSIHTTHWPKYDISKIKDETITIAVQINGKIRAQIEIEVVSKEDKIKEKVLSNEVVQKWLAGKEIKKFIYVKNKLVSMVI